MKDSALETIADLLAERLVGDIDAERIVKALAARRPLPPKEAAAFLGISTDTLAKLDAPFVQISPGRKRYIVADLEAWMRGKRSI